MVHRKREYDHRFGLIRNLINLSQDWGMRPLDCAEIQLPPDLDPNNFDPEKCVIVPTIVRLHEFRDQWDSCFGDDDNSDQAFDCFDESVYEGRHYYLGIVHEDGVLVVAVELVEVPQ